MPSKYLHEVIVGNIGTVYSGNATKEAQETFTYYKNASRKQVGRSAAEDVTWMRDGEIYREYYKPEPKPRVHNEYFSTVGLGNRKSCPTCGEKLPLGESIYSWYEYVRVQKRLIMYFCRNCFATQVKPRLLDHAKECGCTFQLNPTLWFDTQRPDWLTLEESV